MYLNQATASVRSRLNWLPATALTLALALAGCGGSGVTEPATPTTLRGTIADGPIQGATVFLDLNNNLTLDADEPVAAPSDAQGRFLLPITSLSAAQLASAMLVSSVPDSARDQDDGGKTLREAGRPGFVLLSPASAWLSVAQDGNLEHKPAFMSPITQLVAAEMTLNGLTLDEARAAVRASLALGQKDPLEDFVGTRDNGMRQLARTLAATMGELERAAAERAALFDGVDAGVDLRDQMRQVSQTLKQQLPSLLPPTGSPAPEVPGLIAAAPVSSPDTGTALPPAVAAAATPPTGLGANTVDYLAVFKPSVGNALLESSRLAAAHGGQLRFAYETALKGFAIRVPAVAAKAFVEAMASNPFIDFVEPDIAVQVTQTTQTGATWGLDRSDQRDLPLNSGYTYNATGSNVRAFIVDTGIRATHSNFAGRVLPGYTAINDGNGTNDCHGHGTHVAGTVGGATWGIAKGVSLVPVRVLDCAGSGAISGVIAGLDWVAKNGQRPGVLNLSLGGSTSTSLDTAVANTVAAGFTVVVAGGNNAADACNYSPARAPAAITVGATTSTDARASYSNFGSCLSLFGPGSAIVSSYNTSDTATATMSGTSMATPHVAGLAALILESDPAATPATVKNRVLTTATTGHVTDPGSSSPNLLSYTLGSTASTPPPPPAPTTTVVTVANLAGSKASTRYGWRATVTVTVTDTAGKPVSAANVNGGFTVGGSSVACTTGSTGVCSIRSGTISTNTSATTYTVKGISGTNISFDGKLKSITVSKP